MCIRDRGGLVAITAGAKYIDPAFAMVTGLVGCMIAVVGPAVLQRMKIDDVVDAVSVHGFCAVPYTHLDVYKRQVGILQNLFPTFTACYSLYLDIRHRGWHRDRNSH